MSQHVVRGHHTGRPIALVREHGSRVEVVALVDWFLPITLEAITRFWDGECAPHATPERCVMESLTR